MRKWIRRFLIIALLAVFVYSGWHVLTVRRGYAESRERYETAAEEYTRPSSETNQPSSAAEEMPSETGAETLPPERTEPEMEGERAPIEVDFDSLTKAGPDVIGWIYCEGTDINYPVVWGRDNEYYLYRNYRGERDTSGSIFSDAGNIKGFSDSNVILYGHHMYDMSMFASLEYWLEQEYYDEHPVMWLLTPEQDYRVELFSCYETPADSETYTIYRGGGPEFEEYLKRVAAESVIKADVNLDPGSNYVVLSTCAYSSYLARTVVHGKLCPIQSAGSVPADAHNGE